MHGLPPPPPEFRNKRSLSARIPRALRSISDMEGWMFMRPPSMAPFPQKASPKRWTGMRRIWVVCTPEKVRPDTENPCAQHGEGADPSAPGKAPPCVSDGAVRNLSSPPPACGEPAREKRPIPAPGVGQWFTFSFHTHCLVLPGPDGVQQRQNSRTIVQLFALPSTRMRPNRGRFPSLSPCFPLLRLATSRP